MTNAQTIFLQDISTFNQAFKYNYLFNNGHLKLSSI